MDLTVKEIMDQYPNLSQGNIPSEQVLATVNRISNELRTRFENRVIKQSGKLLFSRKYHLTQHCYYFKINLNIFYDIYTSHHFQTR